jgi:hypothetical protein
MSCNADMHSERVAATCAAAAAYAMVFVTLLYMQQHKRGCRSGTACVLLLGLCPVRMLLTRCLLNIGLLSPFEQQQWQWLCMEVRRVVAPDRLAPGASCVQRQGTRTLASSCCM